MIDGVSIAIIPTLLGGILTYLVQAKRARLLQAKLFSDMQSTAIDQVTKAEERMRKEIWEELQIVRNKNEKLEQELIELRRRYSVNEESLKERITLLQSTVDTYKDQVSSLQLAVDTYKKRITELEKR
jgi:chromosome segregation ATPase